MNELVSFAKHFWSKNRVMNIFAFLIFFSFLWVLQNESIKDNLRYGFRDGDWWDIQFFKRYISLSFNQLLDTFKVFGIYTNQVYFIGFLNYFFGLDFRSLYQANHLLKYFASLSVFPLVLLISKNKLVAVLCTVFYLVSYPTIGALFTVVSGDHYLGIIFMNILFTLYLLIITKKRNFVWLIWMSLFFNLALISNTARMYPLIPLMIFAELFLVWRKSWSIKAIYTSCITLFVIFLPLLILIVSYLIYFVFLPNSMNTTFLIQGFIGTGSIRINSLLQGNWQLLIYPFASFGSLFLHNQYWGIFGMINLNSLSGFIVYLITKPLLTFFLLTLAITFFISKNYFRWTVFILGLEAIFYLICYLMYQNWVNIDSGKRVHFDPNLILSPAAFGFYIFLLSLSIFLIWFRKKDTHDYLVTLFIGPAFSLFFIFFTWIFSDTQLVFLGPQRYLTIPAIGSSLFLAGVIALVFNKLRENPLTKNFSPFALLITIPILFINTQITKDFFEYELNYAGMDGVEQTRMKSEFWSHVPTMSNTERSLFYFDETADQKNGYFNESTVLAGFEYWMMFDHGKTLIKERPEPGMLRTNVQCKEHTHKSCIDLLKSSLRIIDGEEGILYADSIRYPNKPRFYKLKNFYAFKFVDKHLLDIKEEVLKELNIK